MSKFSRRAVLSTGGRAAVATLSLGSVSVASGLPTSGNSSDDPNADAELRRLWAEYQDRKAVYDAAHEAHSGLRRRITAEHGINEDVDEWTDERRDLLKRIYEPDTPLSKLADAWNDAGLPLRELVKAIQAAPAEGLYGIGVKLAADYGNADFEDGWDYRISIQSALDSINALIGTDFAIELMDEAEGDANA